VQIVHVDRSVGDVVAIVVSGAVADSRLDTASGQPHCETARMMIAAVIVGRQLSLAVDRAAEFSPPDDQRIIQQTSLACVYSLQGSALYAKFVVDSVDLPARRLFVRHVIDGNCGFKSLVPDSIPTF